MLILKRRSSFLGCLCLVVVGGLLALPSRAADSLELSFRNDPSSSPETAYKLKLKFERYGFIDRRGWLALDVDTTQTRKPDRVVVQYLQLFNKGSSLHGPEGFKRRHEWFFFGTLSAETNRDFDPIGLVFGPKVRYQIPALGDLRYEMSYEFGSSAELVGPASSRSRADASRWSVFTGFKIKLSDQLALETQGRYWLRAGRQDHGELDIALSYDLGKKSGKGPKLVLRHQNGFVPPALDEYVKVTTLGISVPLR